MLVFTAIKSKFLTNHILLLFGQPFIYVSILILIISKDKDLRDIVINFLVAGNFV